jgi:hypothetical protein
MCTRWVPWSLTVEHTIGRKADRETFLSQIFTVENRDHRFESETKRQSMEWHNPQSPWEKKIKKFCVSRQGHDHCLFGLQDDSCRRDAERGDNSYACIRTLKKLRRHFK